jgi:hypothetical protein
MSHGNTAAKIEILSDIHFTLRREIADIAKAREEIACARVFLIFRAGGDDTSRSVVEAQKIYKLLNYELIDLEYHLSDIEDDLSILRGEG